ncbi:MULTISPECIES: TraX family protein [Paenibacillus]|uniref:TraX family protein n=1 Tax=Paenibacillus TaxID=44249 RepID=UPI00090EF3C3|nr:MULTISPECIES: TraX family protein [Paenibacillus]WDQ29973.1 TraX family protein [Paenibacillus marchantiae]SHN52428.1 TraX protein [Paenibacillus sp. ov031]SLJ98653.1 TraX protein [Paenibacillus sp. RU5A]SOC66727.1 TraX protein [Paenibacillus sp. RU26A]SOC70148.1 TraX protein [Paenibacillus sp. RU5M]
MMQWIAMITMLIDHIGAVFYPQVGELRIIGRIAFPIYAFAVYIGYKHTRNVQKYIWRLFWIAVISQLPFMVAFNHFSLNVVWTLWSALLVLLVLDKLPVRLLGIPIVIVAGLVMEMTHMDYGMYGLLLVLLFRYFQGPVLVMAHLLLNVLYIYLHSSSIQMYSVIATAGIAMAQYYNAGFRLKGPRWIWRYFYPAHLAVIALIRLI